MLRRNIWISPRCLSHALVGRNVPSHPFRPLLPAARNLHTQHFLSGDSRGTIQTNRTTTQATLGPCLRPLGLRFASAKQQLMRGRPVDLNIADPFIPYPSEKRPSLLSKEGKEYAKQRVRALAVSFISAWRVRTHIKGWKPKPFAYEAQELYTAMNHAFAKGDKDELRSFVTDSMLANLNADMKAASRLGRYEWKSHGQFEHPTTVHIAAVKVQFEKGGPQYHMAQVTVKVSLKQSVALYNKNNVLVGGNPKDIKNVTEYIVIERWLDNPDLDEDWRIAGKINPPF
ncbi:hypothetical protein SpCBS45565_g04766 [Spizellomyces sp. 'palustris']|nr:hypothetical protein SpCBS45565_g04766 [Spizellomyces sp. 'palustris']